MMFVADFVTLQCNWMSKKTAVIQIDAEHLLLSPIVGDHEVVGGDL